MRGMAGRRREGDGRRYKGNCRRCEGNGRGIRGREGRFKAKKRFVTIRLWMDSMKTFLLIFPSF